MGLLQRTCVLLSALHLASAHLQVVSAPITQCPAEGIPYTGIGGAKYAVCPSADYEGPSNEILKRVASVASCAQICDQDPSCQKAVYDTKAGACHIKNNDANGVVWVRSGRYTTITYNNTLPEQTDIATCPYTETTTTTNWKTYKTCVNTDFRGPSAKMIKNVASTAACAELCAKRTGGCARAVYDKVDSVCHIKADATSNTLIWSTNKRFDVIRKDIAANPAMLGSWSDLIRLPVIPVAAYVVPAFPEPSRMLVFSSWGVDAFGGEGGMTQFADYNFKT